MVSRLPGSNFGSSDVPSRRKERNGSGFN